LKDGIVLMKIEDEK